MATELDRSPAPPAVELLYVPGCPNVAEARQNIRSALQLAGEPLVWSEWDITAAETPAGLRRYASPTVLVRGRDVLGADVQGPPTAGAMACALGGAPPSSQILERHGILNPRRRADVGRFLTRPRT